MVIGKRERSYWNYWGGRGLLSIGKFLLTIEAMGILELVSVTVSILSVHTLFLVLHHHSCLQSLRKDYGK